MAPPRFHWRPQFSVNLACTMACLDIESIDSTEENIMTSSAKTVGDSPALEVIQLSSWATI